MYSVFNLFRKLEMNKGIHYLFREIILSGAIYIYNQSMKYSLFNTRILGIKFVRNFPNTRSGPNVNNDLRVINLTLRK